MPDEQLVETVNDSVEDATETGVMDDAVHDSMVITVPIDDTLSVSGAAADAHATGNALALKAAAADVKSLLSVNGRTGNGTWNITVNGDNVPAQNDSDSESVAEALTRIEAAASSAVSAEATARGDADTALSGRISALEADSIVAVTFEFTSTGFNGYNIDEITADHVLLSYQFFDANDNATGEVLADVAWVTLAGSVTATITNVQAAGSVRLVFGVMTDITPEEVSS